ncbi:hypothetical protein [Mucilaginibacter agri]|uniref:Uncharacterized protein n=1 Tax=Mucilaginibacter agri TaxID=2695265 RepID=A0A966DU59_9SPHI|nr:hypothetical protein [Mucilaginibacter agri]NCD70042.1 hypothetical protein [Mucilaginibacter agri]
MLPAKRNKNQYLSKIATSLFSDEDYNDYKADLIISLEQSNLSFRDLSYFLLTVDHFYGRMYKKGFLSYSMTELVQLKADEIRQGSIEIIIEDILSKLPLKEAVYFYLLIKHLPSGLKSISETAKNFSETFYNYERAKVVRQARKSLRKNLKNDDLLKDLTDDEIVKLAQNLQKRYQIDTKLVEKASRFANEKLKGVTIKRRKKN